MSTASLTSPCSRRGSRGGEWSPSRRRSSTRSSTCSTSTAGRSSTSHSRSAAACSAKLLRPDPRVRLSEHVEADGIAFFEAARVRGLEGIMAKDRHSPYVPGKRTDRWQKVKIRPEQELVVGGWAKGTGRAVDLGALLVGVYEDGGLRYAGKVGAGFTNDSRAELLAAIAPLAASEPPFAPPPPRAAARDAQWLRPELVIRAEFAGWTGDGLVRQAAYKGFELEKDPRRVIRERPKEGATKS